MVLLGFWFADADSETSAALHSSEPNPLKLLKEEKRIIKVESPI